jgi:outer membrane protein
MRRLTVSAVLLCALAGPLAAAASAQVAAERITLDEAVAIAIERSPEVRRGEAADRALVLAVRTARLGRLPTVTAQVTPQQRYGLGFDQTTGQAVSQTVETMNVGVGASLPLYDGGRTGALARQARLEREAAAVGLDRSRQLVALDVAQGFLQLLLDRELVAIQEGQLEAALATLARVTELVEAGARPRADVIAQEAVVAERRTALVEARGQVALDRVLLVQSIGLDPGGDYTFVGPDLDALDGIVAAVALDPDADLVAAALAARVDRQAQELRVRAAEAAVGVARAAGRPSVDLNASVGTGYSSLQQQLADPGAIQPPQPVTLEDGTRVFVGGQPLALPVGSPALQTTPFFDQFADNRSGAIGLTLAVPIFDRFAARRGVVEAQVAAVNARIALDDLDRQLAAEVQQAAVQAETARARAAAAAVQVEAAAEALRVERDRYELGAGTLYDVALAQARLAEAEAARAQAVYGLAFRTALLRLAVGDLDVDRLADVLGGE